MTLSIRYLSLSLGLMMFGLGVYLHDRWSELVNLHPGLHGIDIGLFFIIIAYLMLMLRRATKG